MKNVGGRHQYRLVLCGHKAVEAGAVCLVLMVEGRLMDATLSHACALSLAVASSPSMISKVATARTMDGDKSGR